MAGTRVGALKASATNRERYGQDFYKKIGAIGGRNGHTGEFASNPELARVAGRKGGTISRRGKARPITRKHARAHHGHMRAHTRSKK